MKMFAGLDVGGKTTAICIVDETGKIVWRGDGGHASRCDSRTLEGFSGKARQAWHRERTVHAAFAPFAHEHRLSDGVHGCALGRGCDQEQAQARRTTYFLAWPNTVHHDHNICLGDPKAEANA